MGPTEVDVDALMILWSPREVLLRLRDDPRRRWLAPLVVVVVVGAGVSTFHFLRMDLREQLLEQMAANLPAGQEGAMDKMEGMIGAIVAFTVASAYAGPVIWLLVLGGIAWLMARVLGGAGSFAQGLGLVALAQAPQVFGGLLTVPISLLRATPPGLKDLQTMLRVHVAAFTSLPPTDPLYILSAAFGLFALWTLGLEIAGTSLVFGVKPWKAALGWGAVKAVGVAVAVSGALAGAAAGAA